MVNPNTDNGKEIKKEEPAKEFAARPARPARPRGRGAFVLQPGQRIY